MKLVIQRTWSVYSFVHGIAPSRDRSLGESARRPGETARILSLRRPKLLAAVDVCAAQRAGGDTERLLPAWQAFHPTLPW